MKKRIVIKSSSNSDSVIYTSEETKFLEITIIDENDDKITLFRGEEYTKSKEKVA